MRTRAPLQPSADPTLQQWAPLIEADPRVATVTEAYSALTSDSTLLVDAAAASFTLTLPPAETCKGLVLTIKKTTAANTVTVDPFGAETMDGAATRALTAQWSCVGVQSTGTGWVVLYAL